MKFLNRIVTDARFGTDVLLGCGFKLAKEETQGQLIEIGGWFTNEEFLKPYFLGFKYLRFGADDVGPELGPMGIVGMYRFKGKLFNETVQKLDTFLKSMKFTGYIGIDIVINNDSIQVIGWQPGLTFPTLNIMMVLHNNFGTFLHKVAAEEARMVSVQPDKVGIGVTWLELPWLCEDPVKHFPKMVCSTGVNIDEARSKVIKEIHKTLKPHQYYRSDIGSSAKDELKKLIESGWI